MSSAEAFAIQKTSPLEKAVINAAIIIVTKGLGLQGGEIVSGISNKQADEAAMESIFTQDALHDLKKAVWDKPSKHAAMIVAARQDYIIADNAEDKKEALSRMADAATRMEPSIRQQFRPFNFDRNDQGEKTPYYKEPAAGSAAELFREFVKIDRPRCVTHSFAKRPQEQQGQAVKSFDKPQLKEAVKKIGEGPAKGVICRFSGLRK